MLQSEEEKVLEAIYVCACRTSESSLKELHFFLESPDYLCSCSIIPESKIKHLQFVELPTDIKCMSIYVLMYISLYYFSLIVAKSRGEITPSKFRNLMAISMFFPTLKILSARVKANPNPNEKRFREE